MNVLVVDDDITVLKIVSRQIAHYGHKVVTAENGRKGLDIFIKDPFEFDMILSDIMMPEIDGLEFLEKIRQQNHDIPFIVTTAFSDTNMAIKALKKGATDFLTKPYTLKDLSLSLKRIESMLNTKQSIEQTLPFIKATFQTSMPSKIELIPGLVELLKTVAKPYCQLYGINIVDIATSLSEALTNAVVHGNLSVPSTLKSQSWEKFQEMIEQRESMPEYGSKFVHVYFKVIDMLSSTDNETEIIEEEDENVFRQPDNKEVKKYREKTMVMRWKIVDSGKGFDHSSLPNRIDPEKFLLSGRGLFLIRSFMDKVAWNSKGNTIELVKYLKR